VGFLRLGFALVRVIIARGRPKRQKFMIT